LIEGAVANVEGALRSRLDPPRDLEAMNGGPAQGFEDEVVEGAFDDGEWIWIGHDVVSD
jgi:hypothetical protein